MDGQWLFGKKNCENPFPMTSGVLKLPTCQLKQWTIRREIPQSWQPYDDSLRFPIGSPDSLKFPKVPKNLPNISWQPLGKTPGLKPLNF